LPWTGRNHLFRRLCVPADTIADNCGLWLITLLFSFVVSDTVFPVSAVPTLFAAGIRCRSLRIVCRISESVHRWHPLYGPKNIDHAIRTTQLQDNSQATPPAIPLFPYRDG